MTDVIAVQDFQAVEDAAANPAPRFHVVSKRKFILLFVATLGIYGVYWFYQQWSSYKEATPFESDENNIWPVIRALFAVFFVHSLFRKIKQHNVSGSALDDWEHRSHATFLVVLMLVSSTLDRLSWRDVGAPLTDYLSLAVLAPLMFYYYKAQEMINISCGDPEGSKNSKLTAANYVWIVIGAILWLLILAGLLLQDPAA